MIKSRYQVLLICYALSGMTSLAYEVLWARMLALQFGVSIFGVVVTVAAFMLGLGLGSLGGVTLGQRIKTPLRMFAVLELGIALYALTLPYIFKGLEQWLPGFAVDANIGSWFFLQGLVMLVIMLLPALAMGFIFPLVLRGLDHMPGAVPLLYGLNATGGGIGALIPLYLLPECGWSTAVQIMAVIGISVAFIVLVLAARHDRPERSGQARMGINKVPKVSVPLIALVCYAGIGAGSLMLEIGWTRLLGMVMLRTEYVLAIILAVFLTGVGAGSILGRYLKHPLWLVIMPCLAAFCAVGTLWLLPAVSAWVEASEFHSLAEALVFQGLVLAMLTLPITLVFGAWMPVLTSRFTPLQSGATQSAALLYGANSVGAAGGALGAGFILIPWLGSMQMMIAACLLLLICGLYFSQRLQWGYYLVPLLLLSAWPVHQFPAVANLLPQAHASDRDLYQYEDAVSITHVIEQADGQRLLLSDLQRMDASSDPAAIALQKNQARLPLLLHGDPSSVLFLGLGTGITAAGSLPFGDIDRTAVELSQGAIVAAREWFDSINDHIADSIRIVNHDGRHFLRSTSQHFDVIIGDVFHPDMAGRSALLSVQQFERARSCLNENGWYVQWLALNQFDIHALAVVIRSFQAVFPDMLIFVDGFRLALAGTTSNGQEIPIAARMASLVDRLAAQGSEAATGGEGLWSWLGRYWGRPQLPAGVLQNEWSPQIDFSLPQSRYRGDIDIDEVLEWLLSQRPLPPQAAVELGVSDRHFRSFERAYMATTLALKSWQARMRGDQANADRLIRFAHQANPRDRWAGVTLADDMLATLPQALAMGISRQQALEAILAVRPDHVESLRQLHQLMQDKGASSRAAEIKQQLQVLAPLDRQLQADVF